MIVDKMEQRLFYLQSWGDKPLLRVVGIQRFVKLEQHDEDIWTFHDGYDKGDNSEVGNTAFWRGISLP